MTYFPFLARSCSLWRAKVDWYSELDWKDRFTVDRWNFGAPSFHQNSTEITDVRYGTGVRQTHTCTFTRVRLIVTSMYGTVMRPRDPFLTKLVRARVILRWRTYPSISDFLPRGKSLFYRVIAPIRRGSAFKWNQSGGRPNGFSLLRISTLFCSIPLFSLRISAFRILLAVIF